VDNLLESLRAYASGPHFGELAFVLLTGAAVFVFSLGVLGVLVAVASPLRRRLGQLGPHDRDVPAAESGFAKLSALVRPVSQYALPGNEQERSRVGQLLTHAGFRSANALPLFYFSKVFLVVALPLAVFVVSPLLPKVATAVLMLTAVIAALLGFLGPSVWLERRVEARQRELRIGFPDVLDLLVVCVESGLGLAAALQRVADELVISHPVLGAELTLVNAEMRAGVERAQALKNLAERTGLDDIRGLVALLVQTMRFGTSVADALRVYAEEFRDKRMQAAEEQAAKIGTKMIFPLVLCLFPSFFLVAIGPAVLRLMAVFGELASATH
jgi:tight adherence protein C